MSTPPTTVFELSVAEKLQLVEDLWDDIASAPENVAVHEWQKDELERRRRNLERTPGSALSWDEIRRRVRERHGR